MPKRTSNPAGQLRDALAARRVQLSTRQLERWGAAGLLPSSVTAQTADRAAAAQALLRREKTLERAVLAMFMEGHHQVERDKLELAYRHFFGMAKRLLVRYAGGPASYDVAAGLATRLAHTSAKSARHRELRRRLKYLRRERFIPVLSLLEEHYLELLHVFLTGRTTSQAGMEDLLLGFGAASATREHLHGSPPPIDRMPHPTLRELFNELSLTSAVRNLADARQADLERARADARAFSEFSRAAAPVLQRVHRLPDAFGLAVAAALPEAAAAAAVPGLVVLNRLVPDDLAWFRRLAADATPRFQAMNRLLDQLPANLHHALAEPERVAELLSSDRQQLQSRLANFEREHAADFELILSTEMPANN